MNDDCDNKYRFVKFYGVRDEKKPWQNPWVPMIIGRKLRRCAFVGVGMSYSGPVPPWGCAMLHVITAWGDEGDGSLPTENPAFIKVTDSDDKNEEIGGEVMTYTYDDYDNPRLPNEGEGWYLDDYRIEVHPFIMNVVSLDSSLYSFPCDCDPVIIKGSRKVRQDRYDEADMLRYIVSAHAPIYGHTFEIDWYPHGDSTLTPMWGDTPEIYGVSWDLSENPVPRDSVIRLTTEFGLCRWSRIYYMYRRFFENSTMMMTAADEDEPEYGWSLETPDVINPDTTYLCGGYVTGAFEVYSDALGDSLIDENRFEHEYNYYSDPEHHTFRLYSPDTSTTVYIGNLRFGHSYGYLSTDSLWTLGPGDWIEETGTMEPLVPGDTITIVLNWEGLLPYPQPVCWTTDSGDGPGILPAAKLYQNYPNPFNPVTNIKYDLPVDAHVTLEVYDVLGRRVATLVDEHQEVGSRTATWNAGNEIASGVYFYSLKANGVTMTKKLVILR